MKQEESMAFDVNAKSHATEILAQAMFNTEHVSWFMFQLIMYLMETLACITSLSTPNPLGYLWKIKIRRRKMNTKHFLLIGVLHELAHHLVYIQLRRVFLYG